MIYDADIHKRFPGVQRAGSWWVIDTKDIAAGILVAEKGAEAIRDDKTICICHDIERGLGHVGIDPAEPALCCGRPSRRRCR